MSTDTVDVGGVNPASIDGGEATTVKVGGVGNLTYDFWCSAENFDNADAMSQTPTMSVDALSYQTFGQVGIPLAAVHAPVQDQHLGGDEVRLAVDYRFDYCSPRRGRLTRGRILRRSSTLWCRTDGVAVAAHDAARIAPVVHPRTRKVFMSATLEQIEAQVRAYNPDADLTGLDDVFAFAQEAHAGQSRKSGEAFVNHPIEVALILAELHMDTPTLKAALLHDVVEDSEVTLEEVRKRFGDEVAERSMA
jgi:hypothetical protein